MNNSDYILVDVDKDYTIKFEQLFNYIKAATCSIKIDMSKFCYSKEEIAEACGLPVEFIEKTYNIACLSFFNFKEKYIANGKGDFDKCYGYIAGAFSEFMIAPMCRVANEVLRGNILNNFEKLFDKTEIDILLKIRYYINNIAKSEDELYCPGNCSIKKIAKYYKTNIEYIKAVFDKYISHPDYNQDKISRSDTASILLNNFLIELSSALEDLIKYEKHK